MPPWHNGPGIPEEEQSKVFQRFYRGASSRQEEGVGIGLYLVRQAESAPEFMAFRPFLVSVPEGEQWDVIRQVPLTHIAEAPRTGDRHVPLLGAMGIGFSVALLMVMADQRKK